MIDLLVMAVLVALMAATIVLLVKKWGIAEWLQIHGDRISSRLFACDLCMTFWASVIVVIIASAFTEDPHLVAVPFLSMPIARMMV